jgi:hypothetical protein
MIAGCTNVDIAERIKCNADTISGWKKLPEFQHELNLLRERARELADIELQEMIPLATVNMRMLLLSANEMTRRYATKDFFELVGMRIQRFEGKLEQSGSFTEEDANRWADEIERAYGVKIPRTPQDQLQGLIEHLGEEAVLAAIAQRKSEKDKSETEPESADAGTAGGAT